jgi:hypothetical protein
LDFIDIINIIKFALKTNKSRARAFTLKMSSDNDLFGNDSDVEKGDDFQEDLFAESDQDEQHYEQVEYSTKEIRIPRMEGPNNSEDLFLIKLPSFLSIEPKEFNPATDFQKDDVLSSIRWRTVKVFVF